MLVKVDVDETLIRELIMGVMENYPEASSPSLQCIPHSDGSWGYDKCEYLFEDVEDGELDPGAKCGAAYSDRAGCYVYVVTYRDLRRGFETFISIALGAIPGKTFYVEGWSPNQVFSNSREAWSDWAGDWDAEVVDGLVQCAIFGDVIYG